MVRRENMLPIEVQILKKSWQDPQTSWVKIHFVIPFQVAQGFVPTLVESKDCSLCGGDKVGFPPTSRPRKPSVPVFVLHCPLICRVHAGIKAKDLNKQILQICSPSLGKWLSLWHWSHYKPSENPRISGLSQHLSSSENPRCSVYPRQECPHWNKLACQMFS